MRNDVQTSHITTDRPLSPSLSHHTPVQRNGSALLNLILRPKVCAAIPFHHRGRAVDGSRTPALCLLALCIRCRSSKLGNCPVLRFKIFALCQPGRCFAALLPEAGSPRLQLSQGTCVAAAAARRQLAAATDTPPASCPTTTNISSTRRSTSRISQPGSSPLGFYFLWLGDHSSRHCDGNLTVNLLPTLFLCSRLSDKKGCFNRSFYFTGSES